MNKPQRMAGDDEAVDRPVFISYATADRKQALAVCKALERRGTTCWISTRDVPAGDNYQEAIVRALRSSRAMVLVFSDAANNSDEIKKELSLASRYHIPVMALRIEDVEPSDAFAYELSTRQWIDAFAHWDKSIDALAARLQQVGGPAVGAAPAPTASSRRPSASALPPRKLAIACSIALILVIAAAAWIFLRPSKAAAHTMQVRLTGFQRLSPDVPQSMPEAMRDEITAAFSDDGVIGITSASAPPSGTAPAYALGGTIRRDGDKIRVIANLTNERSGAALWSNTFTYDANDQSRVPRWIAVAAGNLMRCGLFGASTYPKPLPDSVLSDYLKACHNDGKIKLDADKGLEFAQRVVAAAPDFSWGWSELEQLSIEASQTAASPERVAELRAQAIHAADRAIAIDPANSEALAFKSFAIDPGDLVGRENLLKRALAARPLACGCEHHNYGKMLEEVGRIHDAIAELERSTDVMPLGRGAQLALAMDLLAEGRPEEAKKHSDAFVDLSSSPSSAPYAAANMAFLTLDIPATRKFVEDPRLLIPQAERAPYLAALDALKSGDPQAKAAAVAQLVALPPDMRDDTSASLLSKLGATRQALGQVEEAAARHKLFARSWLFLPNMAEARSDPAFPAVAQRLGLMHYWKTTHTRPDICSDKNPPPFCAMI